MSFPPMGDEFYTQHPQEVYQGEWNNMKAQLGKPTGLALALLATLLATFLAMGVFSVALASSHNAERSFAADANTVAPGAELVVAINVSGYGTTGLVEETLPAGFSFGSSSNPPPTFTSGQVRLWGFEPGVEAIEYTANAPTQPGTYEIMGTFTAGSPGMTVNITGPSLVVAVDATDGGATYGGTTNGGDARISCRPFHRRCFGRGENRN